MTLSHIEDIIKDARAGKMFILVDDEDRENEGDLIIPAEMCDASAVNFMAKYGRGLICLALSSERAAKLNLRLMAQDNRTRHQTAFTVSIEAAEGISTGISAPDRARTIAVAIDPAKGSRDIISPGHIFPLVARDGGVLVRAGHTEAAVDIARLAGLNPSGVICEIMNDDGSMARLPDLEVFARKHKLQIATIADLIAYRRRSEKLVECILEVPFSSQYGGDFLMKVYKSAPDYAEHVVLVKGDISQGPVKVRMHALDVLSDTLGDASQGKADTLKNAMRAIGAHGSGVVVLIREPKRTSLSDRVQAKMKDPNARSSLRDYGIGAQILIDLGIRDMILLSNSKRPVVGLEGYGLEIKGYEEIS